VAPFVAVAAGRDVVKRAAAGHPAGALLWQEQPQADHHHELMAL